MRFNIPFGCSMVLVLVYFEDLMVVALDTKR